MNQEKRSTRPYLWVRQLFETITLILLMILAIRLGLQNFHIEGQSMEPTLHNYEYIIVDKVTYLLHPPERGDVIVFHYPVAPQEDFIKRVIAIPGDTITIINKTVMINGVTLQEPYINKNDPFTPYPSSQTWHVGIDQYFVMGDNRGNSSDSRQWGFVPRQNIIGKADLVYWPMDVNNFGLLPDVSSVFAKIHQ
ncbi:MAG TPA: signal peptidase I [Ktedonobacteraceae bacterium]|nr:signal peptidase I [Ktedonobacteraceae bacterium]